MSSCNLTKEFKRAYPRAVSNGWIKPDSDPIGHGNFGAVVDNHDGTVTKLFYRPCNGEYPIPLCHAAYTNEVEILKLLNGTSLGTVRTPELIEDCGVIEDDPRILAAFKMTKLDGAPIDRSIFSNQPKDFIERFYVQIGHLIADYQQETTKNLSQSTDELYLVSTATGMTFFSEIDVPRLQAILKADKYLQEHKQAAFVHGDMHTGNILFDQNGNISGLIDFGTAGYRSNHLSDMSIFLVYDQFRKDFHKVVNAYDDRMGSKTDPHMASLTELAALTNLLKHNWYNTAFRKENLSRMDELLVQLGEITHYPQPH